MQHNPDPTVSRSHRGEVALVTGAARGIGKEIARQLAGHGITVYLGARDEVRGREAATELAESGADVRYLALDVTVQEQVDAAAAQIDAEAGTLDVLVNNAGVVVEWGMAVEAVSADQLRRAYDVNVFGTVAVTQACIPFLRRSMAARVVNLSSPLGSLSLLSDHDHPVSTRGLLAYSSSKAALNAITIVYANELAPAGVKVNAANPGLVASDLNVDSPFRRGTRTPEQGAQVPVQLALLGPDGPSGEFRGDDDSSVSVTVPW